MHLKLSLLLVLALLFSQPIQSNAESLGFTTIGSFSNVRVTQEHQYGSEIQFWEEGTDLMGFFSHSEGLMGDTPTGLLENIAYDRKTGKISFTARLTMGQHFCKIHQNVPSQDLFSFQGKISSSSISGVLKRSDALHPDNPSTEEKVVLKKMNSQTANQSSYSSRADWEKFSKEILKFRGPRW